MTQLHEPIPSSGARPSVAWAGWVGFAAVILAMIATLNIFQGLVALFDEGYFVLRTEDDLFLVDYTVWGIVMIAWGAIIGAAAFGLINGRGWARWFALFGAFWSVVLQIGFLSAYPILGAILILLDILVIFALTALWDEARAAM